jgi:hypothetical protein
MVTAAQSERNPKPVAAVVAEQPDFDAALARLFDMLANGKSQARVEGDFYLDLLRQLLALGKSHRDELARMPTESRPE